MDSKSTLSKIAIVAFFCLILAGGVFWLTGTVLNAPDDDVAESPQPAAADLGTAASAVVSSTDRPGEPDEPDERPPVPRRTIRVSGVTLNNTTPDFACTVFSNSSFDVPVRVRAVVLTPATPGVLLASADCRHYDPGRRLCRAGITLQPRGPGCYIGIGVEKGRPAGKYEGRVNLALIARCPSADVVPCSKHPSSRWPADVVWTDDGKSLEIELAGPETIESAPEVIETEPEATGAEQQNVENPVPDLNSPATR